MTDQNPGLDGAGEPAEELELELTPNENEPGDDPLDAIQDETVRAEAKKHRAIARRIEKEAKKPDEVKGEVKTIVSSSEFLTKADFYKSNERKAIREITADAEIKAIWNEVIPFYTPRRGKETPEDITEDIRDAITLYKARNPEVVKDDSANQLVTTPVVKTGGGVSDKTAPKTPNPPNFKLPSQPNTWYKKQIS